MQCNGIDDGYSDGIDYSCDKCSKNDGWCRCQGCEDGSDFNSNNQNGDEMKRRPAAIHEPAPVGDGDIVFHEVVNDIVDRSIVGKDKYGTYLKTHNGRDATMDLYQELLDAVMYCKQSMMEQSVVFQDIIKAQIKFSSVTFGPGDRTKGLIDHIKKELVEVEETKGKDLEEWIDIIILAMDGAWRNGFTPVQIEKALVNKQAKNRNREWPDWRTVEYGKAIEHVRKDPEIKVGCLTCGHDDETCSNCGGCVDFSKWIPKGGGS